PGWPLAAETGPHRRRGAWFSTGRVRGVAPVRGAAEAGPMEIRPAERRRQRRRMVAELAEAQAGVVSRSQLYAHGISRGEVRANLRAGRWQALGRHCIVVHTGPLTTQQGW